MVNDPIHQFRLHDIFGPYDVAGFHISFTNSALFMAITVALITLILSAAASRGEMVPSRLQSVGEMWYSLIHNMVNNVLGEEGKVFFPLVFSLFSFVLVANMLGMFPYFFTVTSHVIVTAALALFVVGRASGDATGKTACSVSGSASVQTIKLDLRIGQSRLDPKCRLPASAVGRVTAAFWCE